MCLSSSGLHDQDGIGTKGIIDVLSCSMEEGKEEEKREKNQAVVIESIWLLNGIHKHGGD